MVDILELEQWTHYTLDLSDCCITGQIRGVFIRYEYDDDDPDHQYPRLVFDIGTFDTLYESAVSIEETVFYHQLTKEEFLQYIKDGVTWGKIANKHPQPPWCGMFAAVAGELGCWSLMSYRVKMSKSCNGCPFKKEIL